MKFVARLALVVAALLPSIAWAQNSGGSPIPEPGMLMLFGMGAAALGLRLGRKRP